MRRSLSNLLTLCGIFSIAGTLAAQTVTTDPVGFITATVPAAANASTPSSGVVSTPLYASADFVGAVNAVNSTSSFSITGAAFTANQFTATPHLVRFKSGNSTGRFFLITSHTATDLTVDTRGFALTSNAPANTSQIQVVAGNSAEIFPAHTLATLFPAGSPLQTGGTAGAADNVYLFNGSAFDVYFHNGTNWKRSGSLANQNNTVVYPDDGMFIVRRATSELKLTFLGAVPTTTERTDYPGPGSTFVSNRFPVGTTILQSNLQSLPNWKTGATASAADNVYLWGGTNWVVYFYNGSNWKKSGSLANVNNDPIPVGAAMFVVRQSTAQGTQATLSQALPYTL